jgi:hypothetical protein
VNTVRRESPHFCKLKRFPKLDAAGSISRCRKAVPCGLRPGHGARAWTLFWTLYVRPPRTAERHRRVNPARSRPRHFLHEAALVEFTQHRPSACGVHAPRPRYASCRSSLGVTARVAGQIGPIYAGHFLNRGVITSRSNFREAARPPSARIRYVVRRMTVSNTLKTRDARRV